MVTFCCVTEKTKIIAKQFIEDHEHIKYQRTLLLKVSIVLIIPPSEEHACVCGTNHLELVCDSFCSGGKC